MCCFPGATFIQQEGPGSLFSGLAIPNKQTNLKLKCCTSLKRSRRNVNIIYVVNIKKYLVFVLISAKRVFFW